MDNEIEKELTRHIKSCEELAQEWAARVRYRFEEIQCEKATTDQLLKVQELIQKELEKRANKKVWQIF